MRYKLACITFLALSVIVASRLPAEVPRLLPEGLQAGSTHIVTGKVVSIYDRVLGGSSGAVIRYVAEVKVQSVEKGEGIAADSLIYIRYFHNWNRPYTTGTIGQHPLPAEGDVVRIYLVRNAPDLSGDENTDGGFNVLFPNGFENLNPRANSSKSQ